MNFFNTNLFEMSLFGTVLILAILAVRTFFIHRLPKRTFVILWSVALLRLLLPFSVPSAFNAYSFIDKAAPGILSLSSTAHPGATDTAALAAPLAAPMTSTESAALPSTAVPGIQPLPDAPLLPQESAIPIWLAIYRAGVVLCAVWFIFSYIRLRLKFRFSLPAGNAFTSHWLREHPLRRTIRLRQSDCTMTPLTYGIFHPVILMPKTVNLENEEELSYILLHEYTHIRHFDAVRKLIMASALCIHWFNPMVYVMYLLFNRDIELACDENVISQSGSEARTSYALTLIGLEERKLTLFPFCSGFGKNAIEERITAIMKSKKASLFALLVAVFLICGSTAIFAVSAEPHTPEKPTVLSDAQVLYGLFSEEEREQLFSLQIDGYENMTIREFQNTIWTLRDTPEILKLCERYSSLFYESAAKRAVTDPSGFNEYFFFIYDPLTAEQWQSRQFDGCSLYAPDTKWSEQASFEYTLFLTILDADTLTVSEYDQTRKEATQFLDAILDNYSHDELADNHAMHSSLKEKTAALEARLSSEKLELSVNYFFTPLSAYEEDALMPEILSDISNEWDRILSPYAPFGLTWQYNPDSDGNGLKMYYQNREVRGISDPREHLWISEHSGITTYSSDAAELYAVYENDTLSGLRFATEEEEREWFEIRQQNSLLYQNLNEENETLEPRKYPNGSKEDYASLLALMTPDYQQMSVADFNEAVLNWCNANYEIMEGICEDAARQDYQVTLTEEEKYFAELTFSLSREENYRMITSLQTGEAEKDACIGGEKWLKYSETGAWATLYYQLSYQITDKETLTIGFRDRCIGGITKDIQNFWEETSLGDLLKMEESDVIAYFQTLAKKYSTEQIRIIVDEEHVQFEHRGK